MDKKLDFSTLSVEDIVEEYKTLHRKHQQLKESAEEDAQRIHDLKRNLATAQAAEAYLTHELEQLTVQTANDSILSDKRAQEELDEMRRKYKDLQLEHESQQHELEAKIAETTALRDKLKSSEKDQVQSFADHDDCIIRFNALEDQNSQLMQELEEYQEASVRQTFVVAEKEKINEILQDQVSCLEENLRSKRDELEEKTQMLESAQEQLVEVNAKVALLSSAPENNDRKGNSLFAEVDDQRQVMRQLLANQKKSYLQMKKSYTDSEYEIRRLKRENSAMHTELQACSSIFCSADKTYQNKLNERIRQLIEQNNLLESKLNSTQESLRQIANDKSVTWLDSMLEFCKRETDELKVHLHSMHIQKASLEEQLRNVQQNMARWRFESLKSRCVLIDRENLLTEHNISFKQMQAMEFNIKQAEQEAAMPRIVSIASPAIATAVVIEKEVESIAVNLEKDVSAIKEEEPEETPPSSSLPSPSLRVKTEEELGIDIKSESCDIKTETLDDDVISLLTPAKPQPKGTPVKPKREKIKPSDVSIMNEDIRNVRSILSKERDVFADDSKKMVHFTNKDPIVHKLSPLTPYKESPPLPSATTAGGKENEKPTIKPKSNCGVMRRIVVPKRVPVTRP